MYVKAVSTWYARPNHSVVPIVVALLLDFPGRLTIIFFFIHGSQLQPVASLKLPNGHHCYVEQR